MPACTRCGVMTAGADFYGLGVMCPSCRSQSWNQSTSQPVTQTSTNTNNNRLEQLKKENEDLKKKVEEHEKCWWDKQLLQAGRTNAEKARDDAKSSLTKEQTAHQQTKKDKATAEQERDKLKKEHATCTTTIQALEKEKEALQKQLNEFNAIITGVPQSQVQSEAQAQVQQASLPPK